MHIGTLAESLAVYSVPCETGLLLVSSWASCSVFHCESSACFTISAAAHLNYTVAKRGNASWHTLEHCCVLCGNLHGCATMSIKTTLSDPK